MPEQPLSAPPAATQTSSAPDLWIVVAHNERVNRDWEALIQSAASNTAKCYDYLRATPMLRKPKRVFPLKGKKYAGAWEYELTGGDRVFYTPDPQTRKVDVYYAGPTRALHHTHLKGQSEHHTRLRVAHDQLPRGGGATIAGSLESGPAAAAKRSLRSLAGLDSDPAAALGSDRLKNGRPQSAQGRRLPPQ